MTVEIMTVEMDRKVKRFIEQEYLKTKDYDLIDKAINAKFNINVESGSAKTHMAYIIKLVTDNMNITDEKGIDADVDKLLRSLGQDLQENQEKIELKEKSLNRKNSLANILRYCVVATDKEEAA